MRWWKTDGLALALTTLLLIGCNDPTPETEGSKAGSIQEAGVRVRVATAQSGKLSATDNVSGIVFSDQSATLRAEVPGRVVNRVVERGQPIEAGASLLQLDEGRLRLGLQRAEATLQSSQADLSHAKRELQRGIKLKASDTISDKRQDDLRTAVERNQAQVALARATRDAAARDLADTTIRAPFGGIVDEWMVDTGDFVTAGAPIAEFVDLERVRLRAGVTAAHASRLQVGQKTEAIFSAIPDSRKTATLKSIGRVANKATGTYEVELEIDNPDGDLREGMVAKVSLPATRASEEQVLIPRTALLKTPLGMSVFTIANEPGGSPRARLRMISVGPAAGDEVAILEGLGAGEDVVVDGQFALADGEPVIVERAAEN